MYLQRRVAWTLLVSAVVWTCVPAAHLDEYINESQDYCTAKKDLLSCAKFRALNYITNYTDRSIISQAGGGSVRLVKVEDPEGDAEVFTTARYASGDFETTKFFKFIQRQINYFLNHQGIVVNLPEGARFIELDEKGAYKIADSRGKKKKADMLIQLITLFKVFKIKILVAVAVAGIFFIKKVLLLAAFVLPSIIHSLKMSCKAAQVHPYHAVEEHEDFNTGYGGASFGHSAYGGYGGDKSNAPYQRRHR